MKAKATAFLLADLGVTRSHNRPHTSNDNPFSESHFKTLKYQPRFPQRFESIGDARSFCRQFFDWYNQDHHHAGIGLMTPDQVHFGQADAVHAARQVTLDRAFAEHPARFVNKAPVPIAKPTAPDKQISLTDPDARSMATSGKGTGVVGYNVQTAVDAQHHLIVAHEVTNVGNDRGQLATMAKQAQAAMGRQELEVVADRGYYKGEEILACHTAGIMPFVPKPLTSRSKSEGRFGKQDFVYVADDDTWRCPAGERLTSRYISVEHGMNLYVYWTTACSGCPIKAKCTTGKERRIKRWEHETVLDTMQQRLDEAPEKMEVRRQTAEHPFGTIKAWMGSTHFLTKTLPKVSTEMSLHVLAYNLKRVMKILGVVPLKEACKHKREGLRFPEYMDICRTGDRSMGRRRNIAGDGANGDAGASGRPDLALTSSQPQKPGLTPVVGFYTASTHPSHCSTSPRPTLLVRSYCGTVPRFRNTVSSVNFNIRRI